MTEFYVGQRVRWHECVVRVRGVNRRGQVVVETHITQMQRAFEQIPDDVFVGHVAVDPSELVADDAAGGRT